METQARYSLIGGFVIVSIALLVVALLWLSGAGSGENDKYFRVNFRKQTLDGLQKDGDVTMKGIKVGSVDEYFISDRSVEEVVVELELDAKTPVKTDTRAVIKRNILTGIAYIDLVGSSENAALLDTTSAKHSIIPEGTSELDRIAESIPDVVEDINGISKRITAVLSEENVRNLSDSLEGIAKLAEVVGENSTKIEAILLNLESTSSHIDSATKSFSRFAESTERSIGLLTTDTRALLGQANSLIAGLERRSPKVTDSMLGTSQVFTQELSSMSQSMTEAAKAVSRTLKDFEDPRTILTGPRKSLLGPGESLK